MGIETKFDSPAHEKMSRINMEYWKKGGQSRIARDNAARQAGKMFSEQGLSIGEIKERLGHKRCSSIARYLRECGFNVPYYGNSRSKYKASLKKIFDSDDFYENIKYQDLDA